MWASEHKDLTRKYREARRFPFFSPLSLSSDKCQEFGSEQILFQVIQPECLTSQAKPGALQGFCLFLSLAVISIVVSNAWFSPSPHNDGHFSFVKMVEEIQIIRVKGSWTNLFVLWVLDETVCAFVYAWGAVWRSEDWQTSKVWLLVMSTAATPDLKITLELCRDKSLVRTYWNARFLSFNKFQLHSVYEDVLIFAFAWP